MRRSPFALMVCISAACLTALLTLPARVASVAGTFFGFVLRSIAATPFLPRLDQPALALAGPADRSIAASLATEQRHEAGLARLGTVRHA